MIILKHLAVEHFRNLEAIDLHFPERGSILLQGPGEAGKSALLESLYFALYGVPLTHYGHGLDDLIAYGAARTKLALTLSVATTDLAITRTIERGQGQYVTLQVRKLGLPEEQPVTGLEAANERIIAELGLLDGETLRNSYFIEQKGLNRLEHLPGSEREATLRRLTGLEKMISLAEQFKVTPGDEEALKTCALRLRLAETQARIPEVSARLGEIEAALDALVVSRSLEEISQQEADIAKEERALEQLRAREAELKARQGRIQQLRKAENLLGELIATYDAIGEAQETLPGIERQIAELDRREREELPELEKRVSDLADLTRAFGALERMSNDLLTAISTIKDLEKDLQHYQELQGNSESLDEQIAGARSQVEQSRQVLHELEEQRANRPHLEARLQRLRVLAARLAALRATEERYSQRVKLQGPADENAAMLAKVNKDLHEAEQELILVQAEAQQDERQAEELEKRWRHLNIRQQLQEWQRLKGLADGLAEAERRVMAAHERQERLTSAALEARQGASKWLVMAIVAALLGVALGAAAIFVFSIQALTALGMGLLALLLLAGSGLSSQNYKSSHKQEEAADRQMKEASNELSMMVAARETALRRLGDRDALVRVEREIQELGGTVPRSHEEAQQQLEHIQDHSENLTELQQQMIEKREAASASRNQVNATMQMVATLRQEQSRLEEQREKEGWNGLDVKLRVDKIAIEDLRHEVVALAGREGLPIPTFDASASQALSAASTPAADLERIVGERIEETGQEITALDGKLEMLPDLAERVKAQQDSLDFLLERKRVIEERQERFQTNDPAQQIERAREQQAALSSALQSLQDSLRQRVKALGLSFGQAAISNAEYNARKQLEALQIMLGSRVELQSRRANYISLLKDSQDALSEHYRRLTKLSGVLGGWIVPPNPFAETLAGIRVRCRREIEEADEPGIAQEFESMRLQEQNAKATIERCQQEIEEARERIASMLIQHNRPPAREYHFADIVAVWPLVGEYTLQDRERLEEERLSLEQELQELERQELELSTQLQTGASKLDVEEARERLQQQERHFEAKKRGNELVKATSERLLRKMHTRIEYYMQHIVALLTDGRYHDVQLHTGREEGSASGGPLQVRVWDTSAGQYVSASSLSSGVADLLSLALRLAFAIAALPRELQAAPGFLIIDEPLSYVDRQRAHMLADAITGELLSQHFEQILLVSQSDVFDPAMFAYHIYMDGGAIIESNVPDAPALQVMEPATGEQGDSTNMKANQHEAGLPEAPVAVPVVLEG